MRTRLVMLAAVLGAGVLSSPALADKPERLPLQDEPVEFAGFCGGSITLVELKNNAKSTFVGGEFGFTDRIRGNLVVEIAAEDRSVVLRLPGQARVTGDEDTLTFVSTGRTLFLPADPVEVAAQRRAGVPDLALIVGRVEASTTYDPETGEAIASDLTYSGKVVDVCDLLG